MKVYEFRSEQQSAHALGKAIGERWAKEIQHTTALYLDFFSRTGIDAREVRRIGEDSLSALEAWCPHLASEVVATAAGAGLPTWQLASLNARTEIMAIMPASQEGECSTAIYAPAGSAAPQTIQTWDWHDSLTPHGLMLQFIARTGFNVKLFTEFGILGKIGVNSAGIGLHFNILHHESDNGSGGVPVHAIARRILEEASSVQQAIDIARSAAVSASTVLSVFSAEDASLRAASIEMCPARVAVVPPNQNSWLLHTNHFLAPELEPGERTPDVSTTYERLAHVRATQHSMENRPARQRAAAMCGMAGSEAPICFIPDMSLPDTERWETLLTIAIDCRSGELEYAAGHPQYFADNGSIHF